MPRAVLAKAGADDPDLDGKMGRAVCLVADRKSNQETVKAGAGGSGACARAAGGVASPLSPHVLVDLAMRSLNVKSCASAPCAGSR